MIFFYFAVCIKRTFQMVAEAEASIIAEIQEKYVPFLKKLISFLEKTNKVKKFDIASYCFSLILKLSNL
ncbi:UNVERIFIED_CONTAM: hypothetical protein NCL1_48360 [Trichonephila clavipes]